MRKKTRVLVSHQTQFAAEADCVILMRGGEIVAFGEPKQFSQEELQSALSESMADWRSKRPSKPVDLGRAVSQPNEPVKVVELRRAVSECKEEEEELETTSRVEEQKVDVVEMQEERQEDMEEGALTMTLAYKVIYEKHYVRSYIYIL